MKKRLAALFCATLATSMILVGCQASKGLETDNLKITQYLFPTKKFVRSMLTQSARWIGAKLQELWNPRASC